MITYDTLWLFHIAMERSTIFKNGKPSISMGHLYHGELLVITRLGNHAVWLTSTITHPISETIWSHGKKTEVIWNHGPRVIKNSNQSKQSINSLFYIYILYMNVFCPMLLCNLCLVVCYIQTPAFQQRPPWTAAEHRGFDAAAQLDISPERLRAAPSVAAMQRGGASWNSHDRDVVRIGKPLVTKHWKKPLEKPLEKQKTSLVTWWHDGKPINHWKNNTIGKTLVKSLVNIINYDEW